MIRGGAAWVMSCMTLAAQPLVISELMYQPPGGTEFSEAEFVELLNVGAAAVDLGNARFSYGVSYTFPAGTTLAPGARVVVCKNRALFLSRYGPVPNLAPGNYSGSLNNSGENVALSSATGTVLAQVRYAPDGAWPVRPAGLGSSLEIVDPLGPQGLVSNWRASSEYYGSPGVAGAGPQSRIVVNELLAHTDPPLEDAVELFNRTRQPIDVSGWYLSNSRENPFRCRIPPGPPIPPGGFRVIYEYMFNPPVPDPGRQAFTYSAAYPGVVVLLSADAAGRPLRWEEEVEFPASPNGVSFGRYPDGQGPFRLMTHLTLGTLVDNTMDPVFLSIFRLGTGAPNGPHALGPVVINRLRYSAPAGGIQFVELLNVGATNVPLYDPAYATNGWRLSGGVAFQFRAPQSIPVGGRMVVANTNDFDAVRRLLGLTADVPVVGPYHDLLSSSGGRLTLLRPDNPQSPARPDAGFVPYFVVEEFDYAAGPPWPVLVPPQEFAIRRVDPLLPGYLATNWVAESLVVPPPRLGILGRSASALRLGIGGVPGRAYAVEEVRLSGISGVAAVRELASGTLGVEDAVLEVPLTNRSALIRLRQQ